MTNISLTHKQEDILLLLAKYRFLNRSQIQELLNHTNPTCINIWLKDLTQKEYLGRIYSTRFSENTKPAIYFLKLPAIKWISSKEIYPKDYLRKLYREGERSAAYIAQCLFIADICLKINKANAKADLKKDPTFRTFTASELLTSPLDFLLELNPELVLLKKQPKKENQYFVLQILAPTLSRAAIRKKIQTIIQFYFSGEWENRMDSTFPIILLVCPTKPSLISTKWLAYNLLEESDLLEEITVRLAMSEEVAKLGVTSEVWEPTH
jgi:hypothetical protein